MDPLLYNQEVEETIDLFHEKVKDEKLKSLPSFLEFGGPILKKGKQGLVGFLINKSTRQKYVYKISQYLDFMIDQEYNVMNDVNGLRDYCPHFVKSYAKFKLPLTSNFKRAKNPFENNPLYKSIVTDMIVMENLEGCKKFFKYIKNNVASTIELVSIVKQTLLATDIAHKKVKFTHYDLHSDNILIKECDPNVVFLYVIDGKYHLVPTYGRYPVLIDFGFSYSKSAENRRMSCTLAHTKYGFVQCRPDSFTDPKLFLTSVSYEINRHKKTDMSQIFRNIVKNLYKDARVELDCGWDNRQKSNISDDFLEDFEKTFQKSDFFDEQAGYIVDLLQSLVVLPFTYRKSNEKTKDLLSLVINEFSKIEKLVNDDFYNLFILKEIISSAVRNRDLYTSGYTRAEAVSNFKNDTLDAVDRVAKFCNIKLNWERLLCTLLCLGKNIQNYCYDKLQRLIGDKERDYLTIPLNTLEIYEALESNLPSDFEFSKDTIIYTWNSDIENSTKTVLDKNLIKLLNQTHPLERGDLYKDYMENPEQFSKEESDYSEQSSQRSQQSSQRSQQSSKQSSKQSSQRSRHTEKSEQSQRSQRSQRSQQSSHRSQQSEKSQTSQMSEKNSQNGELNKLESF